MGLLSSINPFAHETRTRHMLKSEPRLKLLYVLRLVTMLVDLAGITDCAVAFGPLGNRDNIFDMDATGLVASLPLPSLAWSFLHCLINVLFVHIARKPLAPGWNVGFEICIMGYVFSAGFFMVIFQIDYREPWSTMMNFAGAMCFISFVLHGITWIWACRRVHTQRVGQKKEIIELQNQLAHERERNRVADGAVADALPRGSKDTAPPPYAGDQV